MSILVFISRLLACHLITQVCPQEGPGSYTCTHSPMALAQL